MFVEILAFFTLVYFGSHVICDWIGDGEYLEDWAVDEAWEKNR